MRWPVRSLAVIMVFGGIAVGPAAAQQPDIVQKLRTIPGVTFVNEEPAPTRHRLFNLTFTQWADHRDRRAGTFEQRLKLYHTNTDRPMVVAPRGYGGSPVLSVHEPTKIVDGNQLQIEHRYNNSSIPAKPNWAKQMTVWQAATDTHRVIQAVKTVYRKNWVSYGSSKGGMAATYHHRYYPRDLNGVVAFSAPNFTQGPLEDYDYFLDTVGDSAECRQNLLRFQRESLLRRDELYPLAEAETRQRNLTFSIVGSLDRSLEAGIIDAYFGFWMFRPGQCSTVPPAGAPAEQMYQYYKEVTSLTALSDQDWSQYVPAYFQFANEIGHAKAYDKHVRDLIRYPGVLEPRNLIPAELRPAHPDFSGMREISDWVHDDARNVIFEYGAWDPWSYKAFDCGPDGGDRDCHRFYAPKGWHGARFADLTPADRAKATALLRRWAGV